MIGMLINQNSNQQFYIHKYTKNMWNLKASSKLVQKRSQEKSYDIHRQKLKSMQPKMHVISPYQPDFVYAKHKLNLSRKDRQIEIDRHNQILLNKMNHIKMEEYNTNKLRPEAQNLKTLNAYTMNTTNNQIVNENRRFCEKLMRTKSYYPTHTIVDKADHLEYISGNISTNARRAMSARTLRASRPKSSYTTAMSTHRYQQKNGREKSSQKYRYISKFDKQQCGTEQAQRPVTAPMFSRSQKVLVIPKSGRPQIQDA